MRSLGKAMTGCLLAATALGVGACGSSSTSSGGGGGSGGGGSSGTNTVDIYSTLPLQGPVTAQTIPEVNGMKLALAQAGGKAGPFTINYQSLDDATAQAAGYDPTQCEANARQAATDAKAVALLGPQNSGCGKVQIPITNQAGLAMISTANTYVGLTTNDAGSAPGEPQKYYPTGKRTYFRLVPRDSIQGVAGLIAMHNDGCTRLAIVNDKTPYGVGLAAQMELHKAAYGITITSNTPVDPTSANYRAYADTVKAQGPNCVYTSFNPPGEVQLIKDVNSALPKAKIYGGDGVCTGSVTNPAQHGIPASIGALFKCTVAALDLSAYPGGRTFVKAYKAKYAGASLDPYAIIGYEAMKVALDTIAKLGPKGNDKAAVVAGLFATKARNSVLGKYGFDANGDTTLKKYGLYKVGKDGNPKFDKTLG